MSPELRLGFFEQAFIIPEELIWLIWEGDERPTVLPESNPVFTAVMQLAMRGEVRLDLGKRLTMNYLILKV